MTGRILFQTLIFPGLVFTAVVGLVIGWVDRKVSARVQFRAGPPFFQYFNDIAKLLGKETLIVRDGVRWLFIAAPIAALATLVLAATLVGSALFLGEGVGGDLIVVLRLGRLGQGVLESLPTQSGNQFAQDANAIGVIVGEVFREAGDGGVHQRPAEVLFGRHLSGGRLQQRGPGEEGARTALPMWIYFMRDALAGVPQHRLPMPDGVVTARVGADPSEFGDAPLSEFEYFLADHLPAGVSGEGTAEGEPPPQKYQEPIF